MIGDRLRELRERAKLTQNDVAKKLNITRPAYTQYETGARNPDAETLSRLADILGTTTDFLIGRTDDPSPHKYAIEEITQSLIERGIAERITGFRLIPVVGSIHAGDPIPPIDEIDVEPYPANALNPHKQYVFLRVKGDCMEGGRDPIREGYKVLVEITPEANNGDVVAVFLPGEDEAVLRRIRYHEKGVILTADNPKYDPIPIEGKDVRIYGKVIEVKFTPAAARDVWNGE